jgi:hypothetical protein
MLADFTETARQFFVTTFNTAAEAGLHLGFIDKPLSSIFATDDHASANQCYVTIPLSSCRI